MAQIAWTTTAGDLGTYAELNEFSYQLEADNPLTSDLTYRVVSGELPPGIQLYTNGLLYGIPNITTPGDSIIRRFKFTVRASNVANQIADRTFSIAINGLVPPTLNTTAESLGLFFDSDYINLQLLYTETNPGTTLTWSITNGQLPLGLSLTQTGKILGFAEAPPAGGPAGTAAYDQGKYDEFVWDFEGATLSRTYGFTVRLFDGILSVERSYSITIFAKSFFRTDNILITADTTVFTADRDGYQYPTITTDPTELTTVRQDRAFAFQFKAYYANPNTPVYWKIVGDGPAVFDMGAPPVPDEQGNSYELSPYDEKGYDQTNLSLPPGLILDRETGWLTGTIGAVTENKSTYTFKIAAYVEIPVSATVVSVRESTVITYTLDILQDVDHYVVWNTDTDLGYIVNGEVSTLAISAVTNKGFPLTFKVESGRYSRMPQGLLLLDSGLISGRTTFDFYSMDRNAFRVILDDGSTTFDSEYTFAITAVDASGFVYDTKEFKVTVRNVNVRPYENLYMRALLPSALREKWRTTINDPTLVTDDMVYRPEDPYFGMSRDIKFLAAPGITASTSQDYIEAITQYHSNKQINFSTLKLATAYDNNLAPLYDVIYLEVLDYNTTAASTRSSSLSQYTINRISDAGAIDIPLLETDDYGIINEGLFGSTDLGAVDASPSNTNQAKALSNSFSNMLGAVVDRLGYEYQGALPTWMVSIQPESGNSIGFVRAVVLGHLKPGQGKKLLFRYKASLEASGFGLIASMNQYAFVADRYQWDRSLSINYNPDTQKFNPAKTTTFDRIPSIGVVDTGPWIQKVSTTDYNLTAIDYGNGEYIAVGDNATIITSRGGDTWKQVSQIINLGYDAGVAMPAIAGSTEFNFAYGTNFSLGDQLLSQGAYSSTLPSFITDITDYIRLSTSVTGDIPAGTVIEFKKFDGTTFDLWSNVFVANTGRNIVFDSISNVDRGYSLQIKGIDTGNVANVTINNTGTNTITLSKPLTNLIPASTQITFDDLTGNIANLITSTTALEGSSTLVFASSTADVKLHSYARISNIALGTFAQALNTNVTVTESSLSAIELGRTLYFTSVITSEAFAGDSTINFSSTDKIGIGSAVFGEPIVSSTAMTATWPVLTSAGTALTITIPTADILGTYPFVGMAVTGYQLPESVVTAVTTNDDDTLIDIEFNSTTVVGNPKKTKTANVASVTGTVNTLIGLSSTTGLKLNDYVYSANIAIASRVQITNIFANSKITIGTIDTAHDVSVGDSITFQTPASLEFVSPTIVPTGTIVEFKTATSITLSAPLLTDINIGFDPLVKFGLGEVQINYVLYTGSTWLAVGTRGLVLERTNGVWTQTYALPYGDLTCIAYNPIDQVWVVVGTEGLVARSDDFETWTPVPVGVTQTLRSIEYYYDTERSFSIFVAVGDAGTIISSIDNGLTWTINNTITAVNLKSVKFLNNNWIIVGDRGTVLISPDAEVWENYNTGYKYNLNDVTFINNQYFAVGNKGSILESNDPTTTWELRLSNQTTDLYSIANNSRDPVVVGDAGTVLVQADSYTVDWAVRGVSFEMFNYSSLTSLSRQGYPVSAGDTLIFAQQEGFDPAVHKGDKYLNDGWNNYTEVFDSETTALNYDSAGYDAISVVPGYIENMLDSTVANQRAGVWRVAINDYGNVYLEFVRPVQLNQVLTIIKDSLKLVYDPQIAPGSSVPAYRALNNVVNNSTDSTTFDVNSTRFSNPRDTYLADPNTYHKYLKFPSTGVLQ
jgi:photosystem II stability/assembly factor-like uncharacterized protein